MEIRQVTLPELSEEKGIGVSYPAQHLIHELKALPEPVRKTVAMNLVRKIAEASGLGFGTIKVGR